MNGNITKEGIKLDLEWMQRSGLGGFQNFDADLDTPQVVDHRLRYMTPEWKDAFSYATTLADRLGLEESIAGSPGWSETGGPWVPPSEAMKKYVWSETRVEGGKAFNGILHQPSAVTGPFQNIKFRDNTLPLGDTQPPVIADFYRDSAVVAYRLPDGDDQISDLHPKITSSGGSIDPALLTDGDYETCIELPSAATGHKAWILYEFDKPVSIQAVTLVTKPPDAVAQFFGFKESEHELESSQDGLQFDRVVHIDAGSVGTTVQFSPVTARFFRVTFKALAPHFDSSDDDDEDRSRVANLKPPSPPYYEHIAELVLSSGARVHQFEEKAAFDTDDDLYQFATPPVASADAIKKSDVIDLTAMMQPDGRLMWTPPPGHWVILRVGYSLLGITNHPASPEATGLEVDKLNRAYVKNYMDHYLDNYKSAVGGDWMGGRGVKYVITDSWEAGPQNWTDNFIAEFTKRRGYDPHPWLPVLTGHVVEGAEASDAFLWDFRKTIADLTADEHYGRVEASLKERGMGHYGESHEESRAFIGDGMEVKKLDDVPMSAMWTQGLHDNSDLPDYDADDRESASVAHIYGQNIAAAESLTAEQAPWAWSPATLKPTADKELAEGINRFVIHCSVHQPLLDKTPGLSLGPFGQWFTRNETWAEQARPWIDYLARSSFMLQQGHFSADILYFYGEDSNLTAIFGNRSPEIPSGYAFDYVNADALIHMFQVQNHKITTASGMSYPVLALDPYSAHMSLPVLRSIRQLVMGGAVLIGDKPTNDPSLADDAQEFFRITEELWGSGKGTRSVGKGTVYAGAKLTDAFQQMKVAPDFDYGKPASNRDVLFVHRQLADGDLYYVDNRTDHEMSFDAIFRVTGKQAELWHAETGTTESASYKIAGDRTTVPLHLEPWGTVFVVFRKLAHDKSRTLPNPVEEKLATLDEAWHVNFQPGRGAPDSITLNTLTSWSENSNSGVKYFSGTGTYHNTIQASPSWFRSGTQIWIDLGDVKNLAEVTVNGKSLGTVWHAPFRVDATAALHTGTNELTIAVTNSWVNRLIGDQQPNAKKYTFTILHPYKATSQLLPSGLLGPVTISSVTQGP